MTPSRPVPPVRVDELSIHELMHRTDAARLLDEATRRLAGAIDLTDTDEGLERVQTELVATTFDAIRGVIQKENERNG